MRRVLFGGLAAVVLASALLAAGLGSGCSSKATTTGPGGSGSTTSAHTSTSGTTGTTGSTGGGGAGTTTTTSTGTTSSGMPGDSVLMHHKNPSRDGVYVEPALTKAAVATLNKDASFSVSLPDPNDIIYAQPLFVDGGATGKDLVIVATEANNVYALDGATGAVVWQTNVGLPVPLSSMSCGNIDPFGVTGTPVIDFGSRTLFLDALVMLGGPTHEVFALSIDTGAKKSGWPVVVDAKAAFGGFTFTDTQQGERGALAVVGSNVYVPFGGLYGDCNPYHGWVLEISMADPTKVQSWATTLQGGGMWAAGGIASDGTSIFVATGNTFGGNNAPWGGGDGMVRLGTGAAFSSMAFFAPKNWQALDNSDLDMGTAPVLFDMPGSTPSALAIMFGKDGNAYLVDRNNPGGVGDALGATNGQHATIHMASNEVLGAAAVYTTATATYVAVRANGSLCTSGAGDLTTLQVVAGSPPTLKGSWCATAGAGSPMVTTSDGHADAIVWATGAENDGHLHGFDGDTGAPLSFPGQNVHVANMRRFNTPIAAKGRIFVAADGTVVAFKP